MMRNLQISNQTLVEECRNGDKEALNLFYLRFAPRMLSVIHRYIRDQKDAEDVLHDGFIVALTRLDSLRNADKVELWLATIMKNLSLRFLQEQDMAQILHEIPEVEDTPELSEILDLETLETLIAKLPAGYQKVFRLAMLENKSHKEIGKLLGIAPNSSSSQLFHAKLMMRKLITEYRLQTGLGVLLIIGILTTLLLRNQPSPINESHEILLANISDTKGEETADSILKPADKIAKKATTHCVANHHIITPIVSQENTETEENDTIISLEEPAIATIDSVGAPVIMEDKYFAQADDVPDKLLLKSKSSGGWALNIGADPGLFSFNSFSSVGDAANATGPGGILQEPSNPYPENPDHKENLRRVTRGGYRDYKNISHTNSLPVTVAVSASKRLNDIFSVETGLRYTYLHSTFETATSQAHCHWHYAGIPLKLNIKIYSANRFKLYFGAGGAVDIPLYSNADVSTTSVAPDLQPGRFSSPVMWSLSGNLGFAIKLSKRVDLFLEPTLQYHFEPDYTVPNVWTDDRWGFSLPLGLRLNF